MASKRVVREKRMRASDAERRRIAKFSSEKNQFRVEVSCDEQGWRVDVFTKVAGANWNSASERCTNAVEAGKVAVQRKAQFNSERWEWGKS